MVTSLSSFALIKKGPSVIILLIGAVLVLSFMDTCHAADNTTNKEAKSMEKGMDFLFVMTKGFLDLIQPNRIYEKYDLHKLVNSKTYQDENLNDWRKMTLYLIGFAVCAAIGIVFIVIMPIVGCCLCCCRTCFNNCGGKLRKHDPVNAKYKRGCYATFLTIFNTFILFAVVCTFVTNELYKKRFIDDPEIFNVARDGTKNLISYVDDSFRDLKIVAKNQVSVFEKDVLTQLKNAGNTTVTKLSKVINVTDLLNQVEDLGEGVIKLNTSISRLSQSLQDLSDTGKTLETELNTVKTDVTQKLSKCTQADCNQIKEYIQKTSVNAQFSKLDKQATLLDQLKKLLDIPNMAQQAQERFNSVSKNISDVIDKQNTTIAKGIDKISNVLDSSLNFNEIKDAIPSKKIDNELNKALKLYNHNKKYSSIPWYIGLSVASVLLLIVVCNYLGILFGLCGERAGENTPCCNRGVAANFLLAGVGFYFIFCWILVILVLIEFLIGGMVYTEFCRYLNKDDPSKLKPILIKFNYTYTAFSRTFDLVTYDVVDKCYKNNSILNSINFPEDILKDKIPRQQLVDEIDKIDTNQITINDVKLMDPALESKLQNFESLNTQSINITQYEIELNKTVVTTDLNVIAYNLTTLSSVVNISFESDAQQLRKITNTTYTKMKNEMNNLGRILADVKKNMNLGNTVQSLIKNIKDVEIRVKNDGEALLRDIVKDETKNILVLVDKHLNDLVRIVINEVAPCRAVYDILFTFTDIVCVTFLNPLNGFWFSTGWAVFFFLPTIIFATKLAGLYRCWYKRDPTQNADSFAAGDADHIPLARVNQGKSSPQGMPNSAYDEISSNKYNPPPNHHPYNYGGPGHHYSGYPVYPPPSYHDILDPMSKGCASGAVKQKERTLSVKDKVELLQFGAVCREKHSADKETDAEFVDKIAKLVNDEKLSPEQVYLANKTALYWRCTPKRTLTTDAELLTDFKASKDCVTVLGCSNATGTHRCKLLVIAKSLQPRAFKGMKQFPVIYRANKKGYITTSITLEWFENYFVPEARAHCDSVGLDHNCKIILILNFSAYPKVELIKNNVFGMFLTLDCTSLIQPLDNGILRSLKSKYRFLFMRRLLSAADAGKSVQEFMKDFNVKEMTYCVANAWQSIEPSILKNGWHKIWPGLMADSARHEDTGNDCKRWTISKEKRILRDLLSFAQELTHPAAKDLASRLDADNVEEWMTIDEDAIHRCNDPEIRQIVVHSETEDSDGESNDEDGEVVAEKLSIDRLIELTGEVLKGLEQLSFITEQEVLSVYMLVDTLIGERPKYMKQFALQDMFKNIARKHATEELRIQNPMPLTFAQSRAVRPTPTAPLFEEIVAPVGPLVLDASLTY